MVTEDVTSAGNGTDNGTPATNEAKDGQTAAQEPQPETKKLKYNYLEVSMYGYAYATFSDGSETKAENFDDINRICQMMDDESAQKFRSDVAAQQKMGRLENLLSPEAKAKKEEQRRQAKKQRRDLECRLKRLAEKTDRVQVAGLSDHALAKTVTGCLMKELGNVELQMFLQEMNKRGMLITISVVAEGDPDKLDVDDGCKVMDLVLNPGHMINNDVSDAEAMLKAQHEEIMNEFARLTRE